LSFGFEILIDNNLSPVSSDLNCNFLAAASVFKTTSLDEILGFSSLYESDTLSYSFDGYY
jgi:hypothetical protein